VIEDQLAAWAEFEEPDAWRRSKKGNVWREWDEKTVTIFRHRNGGFAWCINDGDESHFSQGSYEDEEQARTALGESLGLSD
jgi:hypothetical protein